MPAEINGQSRGNCFLYLGPELGEKLDALKSLRAGLSQNAGLLQNAGMESDMEETSFYAGETPLSEIASFLQNASLFSERRLIIIKNTELIKKKDETELLASCIHSLEANTTLVLISDETKIEKHIEDAVPKGNKTIFWELFENKKKDWLFAFFRSRGCRIDESAVQAVLEMVENNTDALNRECSRLILFLGKDSIITAADVEQCLTHTREESVFTLFAAIARGNLTSSLEILRSLSASRQSFQAIIAGLAWCFRKLRDYLVLYNEMGPGMNEFELKKIGIGSSRVRADYAEAVKRWPRSEGALALINSYDYLLRSSGTAWEEILLDRLVFHLARGINSE